MSRPRVTAPARRSSAGYLIAGIATGLVLMWFVYRMVLTVPFTVDGAEMRRWTGVRVSDLRAEKLVGGERGDLVAVKDRSILTTGGGEPPYVTIDGERAPEDRRLLRGDVVRSRDGTDVVEPLATRREPVKAPVRYQGDGPVETVVEKGAAGVNEITYGSVSKQVVSTRVVRKAVPQVVRREPRLSGEKVVALTFDDGPWPGQTEQVLAILERYDVKATFFVIGSQARGRPDLAKKVADAGHVMANHTQTHTNLSKSGADRVRREITQCSQNVEKATGKRPRYFRPPGGAVSPAMWPVLEDLGLKLVQWDIDTADWRKPGASYMTSKVLNNVSPGAVVLMHDGGGDRSQTIQALPGMIEGLKARGYRFVTLDEIDSLPTRMG